MASNSTFSPGFADHVAAPGATPHVRMLHRHPIRFAMHNPNPQHMCGAYWLHRPLDWPLSLSLLCPPYSIDMFKVSGTLEGNIHMINKGLLVTDGLNSDTLPRLHWLHQARSLHVRTLCKCPYASLMLVSNPWPMCGGISTWQTHGCSLPPWCLPLHPHTSTDALSGSCMLKGMFLYDQGLGGSWWSMPCPGVAEPCSGFRSDPSMYVRHANALHIANIASMHGPCVALIHLQPFDIPFPLPPSLHPHTFWTIVKVAIFM